MSRQSTAQAAIAAANAFARPNSLWDRYFNTVIAAGLIASVVQHLMITSLPLYAFSLGANPSTAGFIMGIFTFAALVFRPVFGAMVDTRGRRVVLLFGTAVVAGVSFLYGLTALIPMLLFFRFVHGMGFSAYSTAAGTVIADVVPKERLTEGIGYFGLVNTVSIAIGPGLALWLLRSAGYGSVFVTAGVLTVIAFLIFSFVNYEPKERRPLAPAHASSRSGLAGFLEPSTLPPAAVMFFTALTIGGILTFLPAYGLWRGIDDIGMFFTVYAVGLVIPRLTCGRLADRIGTTKVLLPGMLLVFLGLVVLGVANTLPLFLAAGFLYGFGFGTVQPVLNALIIRVAPEERRGAANAAFFCAMDLGIGLGAIIWGFVSDFWGFPMIYFLSSLCAVCGTVVYLTVVRRHPSFMELTRAHRRPRTAAAE